MFIYHINQSIHRNFLENHTKAKKKIFQEGIRVMTINVVFIYHK